MGNLSYRHFTLGVEEEYMVIDPETKELTSHEQKIVLEGQKLIKDKVKAEMHQAVVEVGTDICEDIDEAYKDVATLRKTISQIAGDLGFWVGASGTHPFSHWQSQLITDHVRYNEIFTSLTQQDIFFLTSMHSPATLLSGKEELPVTNLSVQKSLINFQEQVSLIVLIV
jgi:carboxylate-amine ligase